MTIEEATKWLNDCLKNGYFSPQYNKQSIEIAIQSLSQELSRDVEEIVEVMKSDVDAETKYKMISNILTAKPHYFELGRDEFEPITPEEMQKCKDTVKKYTPKQEPCEDCISREDVLKLIYDFKENHTKDREKHPINYGTLLDLIRLIRELPPVTLQLKYGKWITTRTLMHDGEFYCDRCKCDAPNNEKWDYCPNCGAKMQKSEESK